MNTPFYTDQTRFLVAVDCIIFGFSEGELNLLLLKRSMEPALGCWSLPGGFVKEHESAEEAAARVLRSLTGLEELYMEQLKTFTEEFRDPGERVLSIAYYALVNVEDYNRSLVQQHNAHWRNINDLPGLIFDHDDMVHSALRRLQRKASTEPVGFNLLPEKFTVPQLQTLYEAIYGRSIDKRNFRKKIQTMDFLEKSDEKDKSSSKRGAFLYTFNQERYEKAINEGFSFTL
ncbi:MAG TPA: NUDIX domain-containing protein [Bacteroidales bacterium]|nr:NUDIX domain-containing protein [Bacteroidales bacterium]